MRWSDMHSSRVRHIQSILSQSKAFGRLRTELLEEIAGVCELVSLKKGDTLFRQGDESVGFYLVHQGAIRLYKLSSGGTQQILKIFGDRESFGEATVVSMDRYPANASAECDSSLVRVDKNGIQDISRSNEAVRDCLSHAIAQHLKHLVAHLEGRAFLSPESRVARWILGEGGKYDLAKAWSFEVRTPKRSIAEELDMASETFSRKLKSLREKGLIAVFKKRIDVLDSEGLREVARKER